MKRALAVLVLSLVALVPRGVSTAGPAPTIEQFLMPGTPIEIVAAKNTDRISINCGRDRSQILLLLAAAGAAGITAGIVTSGDASPSR